MTVESKNKRCAAGCTFYFVPSRPCAWYVLIEVKCEVNCDSLRVKFEFIHVTTIDILSSLRSITRYSTGANKYKPISTWMVDSHELEHHSRLVQHMSGWVLDSFSNQYIRTSSIYTNDSKHMNGWFTRTGASLMAESWIASLSDLNHLTLESLVSSSMDHCYGANSCLDRSNDQFLHSLFKEHEPWNRNFPTNNIELKSPPARPLGFKFVWQNIPRMFC